MKNEENEEEEEEISQTQLFKRRRVVDQKAGEDGVKFLNTSEKWGGKGRCGGRRLETIRLYLKRSGR